MTEIFVEKAGQDDVQQIQQLIEYFADRDLMLHREQEEIKGSIGDFFVYRESAQVLGCAALHQMGNNTAEVRAVAVLKRYQHRRIGRRLVQACLDEANQLRLVSVFALTYREKFFERLGFKKTAIYEIPSKLWGECYKCPKFQNCDEVAMVRKVE